ncbi:hypothetical protein CHS0354_004393 [Potamilus streckersoni]|uniref:AB hydrolase-1 domain-containing protein n=1 Tax=Potamilus streckersoni TaxID=2493646 RepID=A0AAE0T0X4_9BIVA|nr:hypothetical protein CHS0354_004393 [Potamilus streckersoni]
MGLLHYFQFAVACAFGLWYSLWIILHLVLSFMKGPITFVKDFFKKRDVMPSCLNDPGLGSHEFVHLKEVRLHYVANGNKKKPLMLLVHGFPEFWYSWRYQLREFRKQYRVVAIDQRGYGDSDKPSGVKNYSTEKLTGDIKQLISALGYSRCVLVGHDWGGAVACHFAMCNPEMVEKLIILNCPHPAIFASYMRKNLEQFRKSWYMMFFQVPVLPEIAFWANDFKLLESILLGEKGGVQSQETTAADIEAYKYCFSSKGSVTNPLNYYRAAFRYPLDKKNIRLIEKPTMIIWGCPDVALNQELAPLAGKLVPDLTIKYIEDASHWIQQDRPNEVNKFIWEFLNQ